jgi:predicted site-specific integrase-resolvase
MKTFNQTCKELNICRSTLHNYRKQGLIKGFMVGKKKIYFEESEIDRFLNIGKESANEANKV